MVTFDNQKDLCFNLHLLGSVRIFSLRALSQESKDKWAQMLDSVITKSKGYQQFLEIKDSYYTLDFWRFDHIDEKDFLD